MPPASPDQPASAPETVNGHPERHSEPAGEVELWWGGYAPRAMLPSFVLCGLLTLVIGGGALYLWYVHDLPAVQVRYTFYGIVSVIWLGQLLLLGYRGVFFNYRLTTRHLYCQHGVRRDPNGQIDLTSITAVRVRRGPLERLLGVGRLVILYQGSGPARRVLDGVAHPHRVAFKIRKWIEQARDATLGEPVLFVYETPAAEASAVCEGSGAESLPVSLTIGDSRPLRRRGRNGPIR